MADNLELSCQNVRHLILYGYSFCSTHKETYLIQVQNTQLNTYTEGVICGVQVAGCRWEFQLSTL